VAEQAVGTVQVDNERVKVTEWSFAPGAETGHHRHEYDYVIVPLTQGKLLIKDRSGDHIAEMALGGSYARNAGVEHNVINANPYPFRFVEIEIK
jgi:quercetin dioxygenase-like cupin family protein